MIYRGVPYPLVFLLLPVGTLDLLFGGRVLCFVLFLAVLFPYCFVSIVSVLLVHSIASC